MSSTRRSGAASRRRQSQLPLFTPNKPPSSRPAESGKRSRARASAPAETQPENERPRDHKADRALAVQSPEFALKIDLSASKLPKRRAVSLADKRKRTSLEPGESAALTSDSDSESTRTSRQHRPEPRDRSDRQTSSAEYERLRAENASLRTDIQQLEREKRQMEASMRELQDDLSALADLSEEKTNATENLLQDLRDLSDKLGVSEDRAAELEAAITEQDRAAEVTLSALQVTLRGMEDELSEKTRELNEVQDFFESAANRVVSASDGTCGTIKVPVLGTLSDGEFAGFLESVAAQVREVMRHKSDGASNSTKHGVRKSEHPCEHRYDVSGSPIRALGAVSELGTGSRVSCAFVKSLASQVRIEGEAMKERENAQDDEEVGVITASERRHAETRLVCDGSGADIDTGHLRIGEPASRNSLVETLRRKDGEIQEANKKISVLTDECKTLRKDQLETAHRRAEQKDVLADAQNEIQSLRAELTSRLAELNLARSSCAELEIFRVELSKAQGDLVSAEAELLAKNTCITELQEASEAQTLERKDLEATLFDARKKLDVQESRLLELQREAERHCDEAADAKVCLEHKIDELARALKEVSNLEETKSCLALVESQNMELHKQLRSQQMAFQEATLANEELTRARLNICELEKRLNVMEAQAHAWDASVAALESKLAASEEELGRARHDGSETKRKAEELESRLITLESELTTMRASSSSLQAQLESKTSDLSCAFDEISDLKDRCASLNSELETMKSSKVSSTGTAQMESEMCAALEKYEALLETVSRLRKRTKRLDMLLNAERRKILEHDKENALTLKPDEHSKASLLPGLQEQAEKMDSTLEDALKSDCKNVRMHSPLALRTK